MCQFVKLHTVSPFCPKWGYINNVNKQPLKIMYFDPTMTLEEYEDYKLLDEINIGYDVEEDLPDQYDDYDDESYIDGLLTDGMIPVDASEMFGDEVIGYSLR